MNSASLLLLSAAVCCAGLAVAVLFGVRASLPRWSFSVGMLIFAAESVCGLFAWSAAAPDAARFWHVAALGLRTLMPAVWLVFSLTYSRGLYREYLARSRFFLAAACCLPFVAVLLFRGGSFEVLANEDGVGFSTRLDATAQLLMGLVLVGGILIVMNLERTFRAAVGTMRWRIKFLVLGLGLIFAARIYTATQALLFARYEAGLAVVDASSLLVGCMLISIAYVRSGWSDVEVYPSRSVLQSSVTVIIAGAYLFVVGVLAQVVARMGEARYFQAQALIVLLGISGLAILLLSDRLRQRLQRFVSRHFKRPQHDSQKVWSSVTERLTRLADETSVATGGAKLIAETFHVLSVRVWVWEEHQQRLVLAASTAQVASEEKPVAPAGDGALGIRDIGERTAPFDLDTVVDSWGEALRQANPTTFEHGGHLLGVPLVSGAQWLGVAVLADRVSGLPYSPEEMELLKCIGDQLAASLLNLRLTAKIVRSRELEAFQTVSAFFVHDLKNAASSLNLTLRNMPIHFDDPAFRADALRAISSTMDRINSVTSRLSLLRGRLDLQLATLDLNEVVVNVVDGLNGSANLSIETKLSPVPKISADRERLHSVLTNLLLNARDALGPDGGAIAVETSATQAAAVVSVSDSGCGMSADFVRDSLFRPFQTTKKEGIGIGMFQVKTIVEAHGGTIQVESEQGKGSTFRVVFPSIPST